MAVERDGGNGTVVECDGGGTGRRWNVTAVEWDGGTGEENCCGEAG
jgi:hypothetical protein